MLRIDGSMGEGGGQVLRTSLGLSVATGTPFGIQVAGRLRGDRALLGAALAIEEALAGIEDCRRPLPDLAALARA